MSYLEKLRFYVESIIDEYKSSFKLRIPFYTMAIRFLKTKLEQFFAEFLLLQLDTL